MTAMKRLGSFVSALAWAVLTISLVFAGRPAPAQSFHNGEITSFTPLEYPAGTAATGKLVIRNTGVAGYFAAEAIQVPAGWTVTPTKTDRSIVANNKTHTFNFTITGPAQPDFTGQTIKFRLYAYELDEFEFMVDESTHTIKSIIRPGDFNLANPSPGQFEVAQPINFTWGPAANANSYRLELYENNIGLPGNVIYTKSNLTGTNYILTEEEFPLPPGTDFHWQVIAVNNAGITGGSNGPAVFRTKTLPAVGPFSFITPAEDNLLLSTRPTFSWTPSENVTLYFLEVYRDKDGVVFPPAILAVETQQTSYAWTGEPLAPGKYHVHVAAFNATSGRQIDGEARPFFATNLGAFDLQTPATNATELSDFPGFHWTSSTNAIGYRFELSFVTTNGLVPVVNTNIMGGAVSYQHEGDPLVRNAEYEWKVTALAADEERASNSGARRFRVRSIRTFSALVPFPGATHVAQQPEFRWQPAENAADYKVEIAPSNDGVPDVANPITAPELTTAQLHATLVSKELQADRDYFYRVAARNGAAVEYNREGWVPFKTNVLGGFSLIAPSDNAQSVVLTPQFSWEPVPGVEKYRVYVVPKNLGTFMTFETTGPQTSVPLDSEIKLNGRTDYWWSVEALMQGESRFANQVFSFTTSEKVNATRTDLLEMVLGKQVLSDSERTAAGIEPGEIVDISSITPGP